MNDTNVTNFPLYNIYNIPEALRKLANEIESNPGSAEHLVLVFDNVDGITSYKAFGKDFTRAYAIAYLSVDV